MNGPHSYVEARSRFCRAATQRGAHHFRHVQPDALGLDGEELSIDLAVVGLPGATRAAVVVTGVHGAEAACGSAVLNAWLSSRPGQLPPDLKLVLIHAANPWGYSYGSRTTENNVDLNRNFRQAWSPVKNASYGLLRPFYHAPVTDAADAYRLFGAYSSFLDLNGPQHEAAMARGQSEHPDGLYFTGHGPEWANLALRQIFREHLGQSHQIGFLDIHTGMGASGEVIFLTLSPQDPATQDRVRSWWQADGPGRTARPLPDYEGLLCHAIGQELPEAEIVGSVMEFGVADAFAMFRSDRLDLWLRSEGQTDPDRAALCADYRESCSPSDLSWQRLVQSEGPAAIDRLLQGLADWPAPRQ